MAYKVVVEPEAQKDIDDAFEYYSNVSDDINVLINLLNDIEQAYAALKANPFFQVRSKHYRALPLKKYPYLMFFEVLEKEKIVKVVSLFNTPQDPKKYV
jgi:addiction module RelE/StbE family toxin